MSAPPSNPYYQPPQQEGYQGLSKPPPYNTQPPPYPTGYPVPPPSYPPSQPGYPVPQPGYPGYPGAQPGYPQQQPYPAAGYPYQQAGPYVGQPPNTTLIMQQPPQQVYVHEHKKVDTTAEDCALGALCMACLCCCLMSD